MSQRQLAAIMFTPITGYIHLIIQKSIISLDSIYIRDETLIFSNEKYNNSVIPTNMNILFYTTRYTGYVTGQGQLLSCDIVKPRDNKLSVETQGNERSGRLSVFLVKMIHGVKILILKREV